MPSEADENMEIIKDLTLNLMAANSLLRRYHEACPPGKRDALFGTRISDFEKAVARGRRILLDAGGQGSSGV